jgi:hypothetical protein
MFDVELPLFHSWNLKHHRWTQESFHRSGTGILADSFADFLVGAPRLFHFLKQSVSSAEYRQMGEFKNSAYGRTSLIPNSASNSVAENGNIHRSRSSP